MNGYKAFYRGKQMDVYAKDAFAAQIKAAKAFRAKHCYEVHVYLCEKDVHDGHGEPVIHHPDF